MLANTGRAAGAARRADRRSAVGDSGSLLGSEPTRRKPNPPSRVGARRDVGKVRGRGGNTSTPRAEMAVVKSSGARAPREMLRDARTSAGPVACGACLCAGDIKTGAFRGFLRASSSRASGRRRAGQGSRARFANPRTASGPGCCTARWHQRKLADVNRARH